MTQDNLYTERGLPPEVEALWQQLHEEALTRYQDLTPQVSHRFAIIGALAGIGLMIVVLWVVNLLYFRPLEADWMATATAQAATAAVHLQQTATAQAIIGSARLNATATAQAAMATAAAAAQAATATAIADIQAAAANATATALAQAQEQAVQATATALAQQAEENRCKDTKLYTFDVAPEPTLYPGPSLTWVVTLPMTLSTSTEPMTSTASANPCAWNTVALKTLFGEDVEVELRRDGEPVEIVQPGESVEVVLSFSYTPLPQQGEWILVVNGYTLFDQPHLVLDTGE